MCVFKGQILFLFHHNFSAFHISTRRANIKCFFVIIAFLLLFACSASLKKILKSHIRSMSLKFRGRQRMRSPSLVRPLDGRRQLSRRRFVSAACSYLSGCARHLALTATQELQQVGSKSEAQRCLRLCNRRLDRERERDRISHSSHIPVRLQSECGSPSGCESANTEISSM